MSCRCSILRFRRLMNGLTIAHSEQWLRRADTQVREGIMRGSIDFAESEIDDHDYDRWLDTITEASARLDALQSAVTDLRCLCENEGASTDQILKVLDRLGV